MSVLKDIKVNIGAFKGLDYAKSQTDEFHRVFGHPVSEKPVELTKQQVQTRARFIVEELVELIATVATDRFDFAEMLDTLVDDIGAAEEKELEKGLDVENRLVAQADALTDINYFTQGTFTIMGVQPQPLFDIVQDANMAKLGPDGKPIYRESDGKIMKPEGWQPPEPKLAAEIERQLNN